MSSCGVDGHARQCWVCGRSANERTTKSVSSPATKTINRGDLMVLKATKLASMMIMCAALAAASAPLPYQIVLLFILMSYMVLSVR